MWAGGISSYEQSAHALHLTHLPLCSAYPCAVPQIDEGVHFGRDDDDESKVKAMEFFCPRGEQVGPETAAFKPLPVHDAFSQAEPAACQPAKRLRRPAS